MVREEEVVVLVRRYLNDNKLENIEALYMWSRDIHAADIANALRLRYGSGGAYSTVIDDLRELRVKKYNNETDDTKVTIGKILQDVFHDIGIKHLTLRLRDSLKSLSPKGKRLLLIILKSGIFKGGEGVSKEKLWMPYHILFGEKLSDFQQESVLNELVKSGIIEYVYGEEIKFPSYMDMILHEIESIAKLPKIQVSEQ